MGGLVAFLMIFNLLYAYDMTKKIESCEGKVKECRVVNSAKRSAEMNGVRTEGE